MIRVHLAALHSPVHQIRQALWEPTTARMSAQTAALTVEIVKGGQMSSGLAKRAAGPEIIKLVPCSSLLLSLEDPAIASACRLGHVVR